MAQKIAAMRKMFSELPETSTYSPVMEALQSAGQLDEQDIANVLKAFSTLPQSTNVFANPVLHRAKVDCDGTDITLNIRSFALRGVLQESEIVAGGLTPAYVIFVGLFGRKPEKVQDGFDEEAVLRALINRKFYRVSRVIRRNASGRKSLIEQVANFVQTFPESGPELAIQHFSTLRKANRAKNRIPEGGLNDERREGRLLLQMIGTHIENVAVGAMSTYMRGLLETNADLTTEQLVRQTDTLITEEKDAGKTAFQTCYSLLLGHRANEVENKALERMGIIQTHHGSAGSNMVARYAATLHTEHVSDFLSAAHITLDGARHFGAIHDMTHFINELEHVPPEAREEFIKTRLLGGGLPTFGHPEIAAAGRSNEIQQDPRAAIYLETFFHAIDNGQIKLNANRKERLNMIQRIYQIAFVEGVIKPGRENSPPLRLTPNTDFGGWSVQEGMGIEEEDRTLLTYIFRGFGWMMDAREQLQQRIIRPVIPPDPSVIPVHGEDTTVPDVVAAIHDRLAHGPRALLRLLPDHARLGHPGRTRRYA